MRVLIDTNVILDWLMRREPFFSEAEYILQECISGNIEGNLTSHMLTDLFYILRKDFSVMDRKQLLLLLCRHFQIITEDKAVITTVLRNQRWNDLEDGLQMWCAYLQQLDCIVTRNISDFQSSIVPALSPRQFIERYRG